MNTKRPVRSSHSFKVSKFLTLVRYVGLVIIFIVPPKAHGIDQCSQVYAVGSEARAELENFPKLRYWEDIYYYLRPLTPVSESIMLNRVNQIREAEGKAPLTEISVGTVHDPRSNLTFGEAEWQIIAGDYVFDSRQVPQPTLATHHDYVKNKKIWLFQNEKMIRQISLDEYLLRSMDGETIDLFRKLSPEELTLWQAQNVSQLKDGRTESWSSDFDGQEAAFFSAGMPFVQHSLPGTALLKISVPKERLIQWVRAGKVIVGGFPHQQMIEIAVLESAWRSLMLYMVPQPQPAGH